MASIQTINSGLLCSAETTQHTYESNNYMRAVRKIRCVCNKILHSLAEAISFLALQVFNAFSRLVHPSSPVKKIAVLSPTESMISYKFSGGRFGDCLVSYLHGKWLEHTYKIPLAFVPFEFSDQLVLGFKEKEYDLSKFSKQKSFGSEEPFKALSKQSAQKRARKKELYSLHYFPESPSERGPNYKGAYVAVNWNDPEFKKEVKELVQPIIPLELAALPSDRVSVAIHWRKGSGPDSSSVQNYYPCKFPPEEFYIKQLVKVCEYYKEKSLYIQLFTDDSNLEQLQEKLLESVRKRGCSQDIQFAPVKRRQKNLVLEDFFSMAKFRCLIRSESHYSIAAQIIGDHELVLAPTRFHSEIDKDKGQADLIIDQTAVFEKGVERREDAHIRFPYVKTDSPIEKYLQHHRECFGVRI